MDRENTRQQNFATKTGMLQELVEMPNNNLASSTENYLIHATN